ncbi:MAG: transcription-repair coupling factor [Clostridia bacterium]|nr:transcription-repair coupling factor [Clostridia bacterium]
MKFLNEVISRLPEYKTLESAVSRGRPAAAAGLTTVHKANVISALSNRLHKKALVLVGEEQEGQQLANNISSMGLRVLVYPLRDFNFQNVNSQSHEYEHQRIMVLSNIIKNKYDVVIATVDAAAQFTIPPEVLKNTSLHISSGGECDMDTLISFLNSSGYERCETVEGAGQYSVRGGIVDLFVPDEKAPMRVEFWGDEIDTINYFDIETQRRTDYIEETFLTPSVEVLVTDKDALAAKIRQKAKSLRSKAAQLAKDILARECEIIENGGTPGSIDKFIPLVYDRMTSLFDYFGANTMLIVSEHTRIKERMHGYTWQYSEDLKQNLANGVLCKGLDTYFLDYQSICSRFLKCGAVYLDNFTSGSYDTPLAELVNFSVRHLSLWSGSVKLLEEDLEPYVNAKFTIVILAGTEKAADSLREELKEKGYNVSQDTEAYYPAMGTVFVLPGALSNGIEYPQLKFALISQGHIRTTSRKIKSKKNKAVKSLTSLAELSNGDYVVHATHGIGCYGGIHKIDVHGIVKDYIKIIYAKGDVLYVPVTQLDLVSKYIGSKEDSAVKLNRLGSGDWAKTKARVRKAVRDMADELIKLYSERMKVQGHAFMEDGEWQHDFEAKFEYEETDDQLRCIDEIKGDMERVVPMDRLLCGDVGFGKTEVALRAAFKCVTESKQCVLLAPTTILAWQHYQTVLRRFEGFPVNIELLSRFRTTKQQNEILRKLKSGEVDFVIGTHRLVQNDVKFRDLGLAIIDEEQRFGVAQKEHFKKAFNNVDILTLSATPIPRTLNMAMSGIRDMSVLEEAPLDRKPVQTYVIEHDPAILAEAIRRELRRGGQVFYLYNRVETITNKAAAIKRLVPEANIGIGHGKMTEAELSEVWRQMLDEEINVLVCTTIIETGVDLPNANTLIIENADFMGLSQLHQLRGRVGRSSRRAYAYFTFNPRRELTDIAQKRLTAIREFTEFGSGFKIAMRDLELRGAGSILGGAQHGHMEDVGYDMYIKMLNEAVAEARGEPIQKAGSECVVDLQVQAHIPEEYISSLSQRLDVYRKIADIQKRDDASDVVDELLDRFGDIPKSVMGLIDVALVRKMAGADGITEIKQDGAVIKLFTTDFNNERLASVMNKSKGRSKLILNSNKPHIELQMKKGETALQLLKAVL